MKTEGDRAWRQSAHLTRSNWPEAIPWMGPKRESGPYPWPPKSHDDPLDLDNYPNSHPNAASVSFGCFGDVCPHCGKPLKRDERVVLLESGETGTFHEINDLDEPEPAYHPECWYERESDRGQVEYTQLHDHGT